MVRQSGGDIIYLVILLSLGGSSLEINSKVDVARQRSSFAWDSPGLYLLCCVIC